MIINQDDCRMKFAVMLKTQQLVSGISINKLAELSGVSRATIVTYRAGNRDATLPKILAIAKALKVDACELIPQL